MSRKSTAEYIGHMRRRYISSNKQKRITLLNEVCENTGYERKYANKLLLGNRKYREHKGRGKTYCSDVFTNTLINIWYECGCPCAPYFKANMTVWIEEYDTTIARIDENVKAQLLSVSESTISRILKGKTRTKPGWSKANKRSGRSAENRIKKNIYHASGETIMACKVPPGDIQIDTFTLGGGDSSDNFFWILDSTDRKTQWTVISPTWNRGREATLEALKHIESKIPFVVKSIHSDNGGEILNYHVLAYLGKKTKKPFIWSSRARKCNDNAHIEEKNSSVGRQLFGEIRLDNYALLNELIILCDEWSDFHNFFRPCKMLISKKERSDKKGFICKYDKPKTPFQRVLDEHILSPEEEVKLITYRQRLCGMDLYRRVCKRLRKIKRLQAEYNAKKRISGGQTINAVACSTSLLRSAPTGTVELHNSVDSRSIVHITSRKEEMNISVQYLTNQKPPDYLSGVFSI